MSTSSSPAVSATQAEKLQPFPYVEACGSPGAAGTLSCLQKAESDLVEKEQAARLAGQREGETRARQMFAGEVEQLRGTLGAALSDFSEERHAYYQQVEREVVQLSLNIARSILHREVQIDPLLLAGMAHAALEKIETGTKVALRVHPQAAEAWRGYFESRMTPGEAPEIVEDAALAPDRCLIQTSLGATELGIAPQLREIEQGLLDLIAKRPRESE